LYEYGVDAVRFSLDLAMARFQWGAGDLKTVFDLHVIGLLPQLWQP